MQSEVISIVSANGAQSDSLSSSASPSRSFEDSIRPETSRGFISDAQMRAILNRARDVEDNARSKTCMRDYLIGDECMIDNESQDPDTREFENESIDVGSASAESYVPISQITSRTPRPLTRSQRLDLLSRVETRASKLSDITHSAAQALGIDEKVKVVDSFVKALGETNYEGFVKTRDGFKSIDDEYLFVLELARYEIDAVKSLIDLTQV